MLDGLSVIKVDFAGTERPYSSYGRYYKRVHDRTEEMTPDELKHMMLNMDYSSIWENNIVSFSSILYFVITKDWLLWKNMIL